MHRRNFIKAAALATSLPTISLAGNAVTGKQQDLRKQWLQTMQTMAEPVLTHLAAGTLKKNFPYKTVPGNDWDRRSFSRLEAFGRLATGITPWLSLSEPVSTDEEKLKSRYKDLFLKSVAMAVNPESPEYMNFDNGMQPLVDTAFLAQSIVRAPGLFLELDVTVRQNLLKCLETTRKFVPYANNWILFSAMVEAGIEVLGGNADKVRINLAMQQMTAWYKGDSMFGDGADFHFDYYNSIVIIPFMLELTELLYRKEPAKYENDYRKIQNITRRHTEILERMIGADGSFPPVGRSIIYRTGLFHLPALAGLKNLLPAGMEHGSLKSALTALIQKCLTARNTYDEAGWLNIGVHGNQPELAEKYISTGSVYMAAAIFLPLGLSPTHEFWQSAPTPFTAQKIWNNEPGKLWADKALKD